MENEVNKDDLSWLVNVPSGDSNFKYTLERANEATIRAAIAEVEGQVGKKVVEVALKRRLAKLLDAQGEQVAASEARQTRAVTMDLTTLQAERDQQQAVVEQQADREMMIGQCYKAIGQVQTSNLFAKFATVSSLVWLRQVKEQKIYRDIPGVGTWEKFCENVGMSRQKVDEDLANLSAFGESFLTTCQQLSVGYRELRQLRQLKYDGDSFQMSDDGKTVVIEGEAIALGEDAGAEIEAALEKLLVKNKTLRERNTRLEKDLKGVVKEETAGLLSEKKALLERVKTLEVYEPSETNREWSVKQMATIEEAGAALQLAIAGFIIDPRLKDDRHLQAQVNAHLHEAELALHDVRTRLDEVIDMFN